jgi:hypothetical protein
LQVGSASKFKVDKSGNITTAAGITTGVANLSNILTNGTAVAAYYAGGFGFLNNGTGYTMIGANPGGGTVVPIVINYNSGTGALAWSNGFGATPDTALSRVGVGIVGVGTGAAGSTVGTLRAAALAAGGSDVTITAVNSVSPTSPNRTITISYGGTTYYLAAKTTND